jgi:phosphate transport system permease protein
VLILTVMLLPLVVALTRQALLAVPTEQREAVLSVGCTPWEVVRYAALPYARAGIAGAIILALGRALGETIAVAMVIGGSHKLPASLLDQGYTIASVIANEFTEVSSPLYLSALIEAGFVLFILTSAMNVLAHWLIRRIGVRSAESL